MLQDAGNPTDMIMQTRDLASNQALIELHLADYSNMLVQARIAEPLHSVLQILRDLKQAQVAQVQLSLAGDMLAMRLDDAQGAMLKQIDTPLAVQEAFAGPALRAAYRALMLAQQDPLYNTFALMQGATADKLLVQAQDSSSNIALAQMIDRALMLDHPEAAQAMMQASLSERAALQAAGIPVLSHERDANQAKMLTTLQDTHGAQILQLKMATGTPEYIRMVEKGTLRSAAALQA